MSEDLNLPASLERLEINPERVECCKMDQNRNLVVNVSAEPECTLQSLSLKAECPKGNCHCNRKREKEVTVKRLAFKRPIVRRSKLNALVLRSPILRLRDSSSNGATVLASHAQPTTSATLPTIAIPSPEDPSTQTLPLVPSRLSEEDTLSEETERLTVSPATNPSATQSLSSSSCAVQARSSPDDTTIDELASYFDLFVHIPKKMSFMAEMMYT